MRADQHLPDLENLPEVRAAIAVDETGRLLDSTVAQAQAVRDASSTAAVIRELAALASAAGVGALDTFVVRARSGTAVVVVRSGAFVQATLAPAHATLRVERTLGQWMAAPTLLNASELQVVPVGRNGETAPEGAGGAPADAPGSLAAAVAQAQGAAVAEVPPPAAQGPEVTWATLRRALARGQLADASVLRGGLGQGEVGGAAAAPEATQQERALDALLAGIGSALSGDALAALRSLREVASEVERNRTFRWLALHWGTLAAVGCGSPAAARSSARQAVLVARELDAGALGVSSWAAAEVLLAENDGEKALQWVAQARVQLERCGDAWGLGRACLAEARALAAMQRDEEAALAAQRASGHDAAWDEPPVFLARRCLERGAVDEAEERVRAMATAAAERVRLTAQAIRDGALGQADAIELLRHQEAPPSADAARVLVRISQAAPRLPVPREALARMLLRAGKYAEAERHFSAVAATPLPPVLRSAVMLGLGCVAQARRRGPPALGGGAAVPASAAVFSGKLSVFAVPDLLEFLRSARRTGLLRCSAAAGASALWFREGRIVAAASPSAPSVGALLVRSRKLSPVVLDAVLQRQAGPARTDGALGEILVREGLVAREDVRAALREQIRLAVRELVGFRDGDFAFDNDEAGGGAELAVEVDPQEVLLDALRELDEAARSRART